MYQRALYHRASILAASPRSRTSARGSRLAFDAARPGAAARRLPDFNVTIKGNLDIKANAQVDYQSTIIQSGAAYEVAKWGSGPNIVHSLVRLWAAHAIETRNRHLSESCRQRYRGCSSRFQTPRAECAALSKRSAEPQSPALATLNGSIRSRRPYPASDCCRQGGYAQADVGGFGAGSDFSWQVVGTYGFDVDCFGTPPLTVIGYRALAVDYSENGQFGRNDLDFVEHGPVMGVKLRS